VIGIIEPGEMVVPLWLLEEEAACTFPHEVFDLDCSGAVTTRISDCRGDFILSCDSGTSDARNAMAETPTFPCPACHKICVACWRFIPV